MEERERLSSVIPNMQQLKTCGSCLCRSFPNLRFWFYSERFWLKFTTCSCSMARAMLFFRGKRV